LRQVCLLAAAGKHRIRFGPADSVPDIRDTRRFRAAADLPAEARQGAAGRGGDPGV